jgi:uncharacterized protein YpmS
VSRRWIKRFGLCAIIVVLVCAAGAMTGYMLWRGKPAWYRPNVSSEEERRIAAANAERQLTSITNWANRQRALEDAAAYAKQTGATPATHPNDELIVSFTQDELNAFFDKWSVMYDWPEKYNEYLSDPAIVLRKNRLILAGNVKSMGTITSLHFTPTLDESGKLFLKLASVQAGRLPLPETFWGKQRDELVKNLRENLPRWQRLAKIESNGSTNASAMSAAFTEMLLDAARGDVTDAVLFLPLLDHDRSVPVRLTSVVIEDGAMTLTVVPMSAGERAALLERIRRPIDTATARR